MTRSKKAKGNVGRRTSLTVSRKRKVSGTAAKGNRSSRARYEVRQDEVHQKQRKEDISKLDSDDSCGEDEGYVRGTEKNDNELFNEIAPRNETMDDGNGGCL